MKASANISRLVTPVAFSYLYQYAGPRAMYATLATLLAGLLTGVLLSFRRLTANQKQRDEETPLLGEQVSPAPTTHALIRSVLVGELRSLSRLLSHDDFSDATCFLGLDVADINIRYDSERCFL